MRITVCEFFDTLTGTYSYLVVDKATGKAAIIDPVLNFELASGASNYAAADTIIEKVRALDADVIWILETHVHADHLSACAYLKKRFPKACSAIGEKVTKVQSEFADIFPEDTQQVADGHQWDQLLVNGELLSLGESVFEIMETPGHTPACISYLIENCVFVGDTLFMPDYGTARCDFPGGDAKLLYHSIQKIYALDDVTRIYLCHDYPPADRSACFISSVGEQKKHNVHLSAEVSELEFVQLRNARDKNLKVPALIIPALQVNLVAGQLPNAESNGVAYLKIPLNQLK